VYLDDGDLPMDDNHIENRIRPVALGRSNWLFAGSLRAGQRAAAIMSLIQSERLNGHDPYRYLKDVLERLPTQLAIRIEELLPHLCQPSQRPTKSPKSSGPSNPRRVARTHTRWLSPNENWRYGQGEDNGAVVLGRR
jgi:hypothetical protein